MFGDLHIENFLLVIHADIIKGSGLKQILEENELSVAGPDVMVNVDGIKKARYCLQVRACAIYGKLKVAQGKQFHPASDRLIGYKRYVQINDKLLSIGILLYMLN